MNTEIEKLIVLAQEAGSINQAQRALILKKAAELNDDVDEVEMILENIPLEQEPSVTEKKEEIRKSHKCPNCGATISDLVLSCPECGYVFPLESISSKANRDYIAELQKKIKLIQSRGPKNEEERDEKWGWTILEDNKEDEIRQAIQSFSVPNTKEALIQAFISCYSYYETNKLQKIFIANAWLAKAREFYRLIKAQPILDDQTTELLNRYQFIEQEKSGNSQYTLLAGITFVAICAAITLILIFGNID